MKERSRTFSYPMLIKENHLDTFGHVNNAVYLQILEEARWDFVTANGYGLKEVMEIKKGPVILEVNLQFRKELANRESIVIETYCTPFRGRIGKVFQVIKNSRNEECCRAEFTFGFFDLEARKLISPNNAWLKATDLLD